MLKDSYADGYNIAKELLNNPDFRNVVRTSIMKIQTNEGLEGFLESMEDNTQKSLEEIITKTKAQ
jgi:hypothetical protein